MSNGNLVRNWKAGVTKQFQSWNCQTVTAVTWQGQFHMWNRFMNSDSSSRECIIALLESRTLDTKHTNDTLHNKVIRSSFFLTCTICNEIDDVLLLHSSISLYVFFIFQFNVFFIFVICTSSAMSLILIFCYVYVAHLLQIQFLLPLCLCSSSPASPIPSSAMSLLFYRWGVGGGSHIILRSCYTLLILAKLRGLILQLALYLVRLSKRFGVRANINFFLLNNKFLLLVLQLVRPGPYFLPVIWQAHSTISPFIGNAI